MAKLSNEELIESFKELTLIELSEFVKLFEETFDVKAAAPAAVAAPGRAGRRRRGPRGAGRVRRHPRVRRRQEDPGHQGRARADLAGSEGGQGPRRRRAEGAAREGQQGGRREGQGEPRGRRRRRHRQVVLEQSFRPRQLSGAARADRSQRAVPGGSPHPVRPALPCAAAAAARAAAWPAAIPCPPRPAQGRV
jgi:hypothetical protein